MPLITQWVKDRFSATASVYIPREATNSPNSPNYSDSYFLQPQDLPPYRMGGSRSEPNSPERGGEQPSQLSIRLPAFARYNLWPRSKKPLPLEPTTPQSVIPPPPPQVRSPTSLSDHAIPAPRKLQKFYRGGNLASRRKISVPELREKPTLDSFDQLTPLEPLVDSRKSIKS
jgi:hypothetical protein